MTADQPPAKPNCPICESNTGIICRHCDDTHPQACEVDVGWELLTPLGRWEDVTAVDDGQTMVYLSTKQSGEVAWSYWRTDHVDARPPRPMRPGNPELRLVEYRFGDVLSVIACQDTHLVPAVNMESIIVTARNAGRGHGWDLTYYDPDTRKPVTTNHPSKAKVRTALNALGRQYAKKLGVPYRTEEKRG